MDQDFRLVQPRCIGWRIARLPPSPTLGEVTLRASRYVTGPAILDQEDAVQLLVLPVKQFQFRKIVLMIILRQEYQIHQPGMHYQEYQHVHCPVPCVVELLLLDRSRDRSADRITLQRSGKLGFHRHTPPRCPVLQAEPHSHSTKGLAPLSL